MCVGLEVWSMGIGGECDGGGLRCGDSGDSGDHAPPTCTRTPGQPLHTSILCMLHVLTLT